MTTEQPSAAPQPEPLTSVASSLPLVGEKKRFQVIGAILLFLFVIIVNVFITHPSKKDKAPRDEETYSSNVNPVSKTSSTSEATLQTPLAEDNKAHVLEEKIATAKAQDFVSRLQAPQNTGNSYGNSASASGSSTPQPAAVLTAPEVSTNQDPNTAFLLQASTSKAQHGYATHFGPLPFVIGQGKFIFGTLSVAINSDLPGQIEGVVSQDVYGEQGTKVLIPQGSRLIGEYKSGLANNQSRLFTVWTRIIEPNGVDIQLGSEGTDALGRAGLTGNVDYHFFDRFGSALLISMIGAGTATVGVSPSDQYNSASAYRSSVAGALSEQGKSLLAQNINIPPTIKIKQGEKIIVFVNRDLDFSRVYR